MNAWILMLQGVGKVRQGWSGQLLAGGFPSREQESRNGNELRSVTKSDTNIHATQAVFVGFEGFGVFGVGVVFQEMGGVPFLPGDHRVVGSG